MKKTFGVSRHCQPVFSLERFKCAAISFSRGGLKRWSDTGNLFFGAKTCTHGIINLKIHAKARTPRRTDLCMYQFVTYLWQGVLHHIVRVSHDSRWKLAPTTITQRPRSPPLSFSLYLSSYFPLSLRSSCSVSDALPSYIPNARASRSLSLSLSLSLFLSLTLLRGFLLERTQVSARVSTTREQEGTMTSARGRLLQQQQQQQHREGIPWRHEQHISSIASGRAVSRVRRRLDCVPLLHGFWRIDRIATCRSPGTARASPAISRTGVLVVAVVVVVVVVAGCIVVSRSTDTDGRELHACTPLHQHGDTATRDVTRTLGESLARSCRVIDARARFPKRLLDTASPRATTRATHRCPRLRRHWETLASCRHASRAGR